MKEASNDTEDAATACDTGNAAAADQPVKTNDTDQPAKTNETAQCVSAAPKPAGGGGFTAIVNTKYIFFAGLFTGSMLVSAINFTLGTNSIQILQTTILCSVSF
jgi:hypothetical protein